MLAATRKLRSEAVLPFQVRVHLLGSIVLRPTLAKIHRDFKSVVQK